MQPLFTIHAGEYLVGSHIEYKEGPRQATENNQDDWYQAFRHSAESFGRLAEIQSLRADLYEAENVMARLTYYWHIWKRGGYLGPQFVAMGWKSALKNFARLSFGTRISTRVV